VNLQVRLTGSGERARPPLGPVAYLECSLLWEYVLQLKRGHDTVSRYRVRRPRPGRRSL